VDLDSQFFKQFYAASLYIIILNCLPLGKPQKKKVHPLVAEPLRGGGGGKGRAIKEKRSFFKTFFFNLLPFKNKNFYFRQLIEIWTYRGFHEKGTHSYLCPQG
jgi:hypothetical protein